MQKLTALSVFVSIVVLAVAVGGQFVGGDWYHQVMKQPSWNPSALVMASVWAVLYVLMAVAAWMVWDAMRGLAQAALGWWGLQLLLSVAWSWTFFGLHRIGWSMAVMGSWVLVALVTAKSFKSVRVEAYSLMLVVVIWLLLMLGLNFNQWLINGGGLSSLV